MKTVSRSTLLALFLAVAGCGGGGSTATLVVTPATLSLQAGGAATSVTAALTGGTGPVTWSLSPGTGALSGTSGDTVFYTPPGALPSALTEVLTASAAGKTAQVTIAVSPAPASLVITPPSASVVAGDAPVSFAATLSGATGAITWRLNPLAVGTLSATTGTTVSWTPPPAPIVQATSATLTASAAGLTATASIMVVPSGPVSILGWTYHPPSDWTSGALALPVPAGKSAMVILLNTDPSAAEGATASLTVTGTATVASQLAPITSALSAAGFDPELALALGHARVRAAEAALAPLLAATKASGLAQTSQALVAPANPASFCVANGTPGTGATYSRISAPLASTTAHALFYVDSTDVSDFQTSDWSNLGTLWEQQIYPSDTGIFGPPSDVDGNGKLIILFTSKVGGLSASAITAGYYWPGYLFGPDNSTGCNCGATGGPACPVGAGSLGATIRGSNAADMFVMNTPSNLATANFTRTVALTRTIPSTLAHELQHLISFNLHCLVPANCPGEEEIWLNEAMSKVAEDEAGFGWTSSVTSARQYLALAPSSGFKGYSTASMTLWEGDPIGNYEGVHSFMRYLTDRKGTALLSSLSGSPAAGNTLSGKANLTSALGATFESAMADFTTAAALSNESFVPDARFNYTGSEWTPFHTALRHLEYQSLNPGAPGAATLRKDGWNAFATGAAGASGATIQVQSSQAVKPAVLLVTFTGTLPKA